MRNIEFRATNEFGEIFSEKLDGRSFTRFVEKEAKERNIRKNKVINDWIKCHVYKYLSKGEITSYEFTWFDEFNRRCKIEQYNIVLINKETYSIVQRISDNNKYKYNYYDYTNDKELFNEWYDGVSLFHNGFARVEREDDGDYLCNFIDKQGKILSDEWFKSVDYFNKDGFARVQRTNGELCKIDKNGKIVSK